MKEAMAPARLLKPPPYANIPRCLPEGQYQRTNQPVDTIVAQLNNLGSLLCAATRAKP